MSSRTVFYRQHELRYQDLVRLSTKQLASISHQDHSSLVLYKPTTCGVELLVGRVTIQMQATIPDKICGTNPANFFNYPWSFKHLRRRCLDHISGQNGFCGTTRPTVLTWRIRQSSWHCGSATSSFAALISKKSAQRSQDQTRHQYSGGLCLRNCSRTC